MSDDFSKAIEEMSVKAKADNVPKDVVEHFEEEGEVIDAQIKENGTLGVTASKLGMVGSSMEAYIDSFMTHVSTESWDARTARQFDMGVQTILESVGLSMESVNFEPSFEAQGVYMGKEEQKDHAEKASDGVLKKIYTWLMNALKGLITSIKNFFNVLERMAGSIDKIAGELATLVKGRTFKDGKVKGSWSRYLKAGDKSMSGSEALTMAQRLMHSIADAFAADIASSAAVVKNGGAAKTDKVAALHWPISWPGGTVMKLEGGSDLTAGKFASSKSEASGGEVSALSRSEADAIVKQVTAAGGAVRSLRTKLSKQVAQYETWTNNAIDPDKLKRGGGDMAAGRRAAALTGMSNSVNKACATALFDVVRCAVQHVKASMAGGSEE